MGQMMMRSLPANGERYYDLFDDWELIVSSLLQQYGIRVYSTEFKRMKWAELSALIAGIGPDTPLGRIVSIRAESDKDRIKEFTPDQKRIWSAWRKKLAGQKWNRCLICSKQDSSRRLRQRKKRGESIGKKCR